MYIRFLRSRLLGGIRSFHPAGLQSHSFQLLSSETLALNGEHCSIIKDPVPSTQQGIVLIEVPLQCEGCLLLVNTILKLPSLLYLRSIRSKNRRVFSLSNSQCPTSSIIRQDGRTKPLSTEASFPARLAAVNLSCNSDILMK